MNKEEFKNGMRKIKECYNKNFSHNELLLWFENFKNIDFSEFDKAINKTIQEVKFMPKIADIRARLSVNPNSYYTDDLYRHLYKNNGWGKLID